MTAVNEPSRSPGAAGDPAATTAHTAGFTALAPLRRRVRALARGYGLDAETRARLVLSVVKVARLTMAAGHAVTLSSSHERDPARGPAVDAAAAVAAEGATQEARRERPWGVLTVRLRPDPPRELSAKDLPLIGDASQGDGVVWRVPLAGPPAGPLVPAGRRPAGPAAEDEVADMEEEMLALVSHTDRVESEHRLLKHELAETNSGVLAMYVQLEERDEALRTAHGKTLRELEDALRPPPIEVAGLETAVHYAPAGTDAPTGGDLYDWFTLPDGRLHITVVDALGHGVTSTRSALNVTHAVRTLALEGHRLESIVARADEILLPFDPELMATVMLIRLDPATGDLELANGSHPPALLLRSTGESEYLEVRGRGVGFPLAGSERVLRRTLGKDDLLLLYTDGLTESRRDPKEGEKRLVEAGRAHFSRPIADVPGAIAADMHTVILHPDDTLALSVRRTG
ncbi:PP2C family protein-serine/threonine phosphatase [Streptomyces sp. NPDC059740]|uniref:PP2C family protein-serine/threonine phosphatase n=1 Tax=Streptomyces sp. NPDC059740 TaxID=3346926 RepID=UPI0036582216